MKQILVTTSWDDGHMLDARLAELLKKYGIKGTFYIAPENYESKPENRLSNAQIKKISTDFEIGAHTMTHAHLTKISDAEAYSEIVDSKKYLEEVTGQEVLSFCYPRGEYHQRHVAMVRDAGFAYARTIGRFSSGDGPLLEAETSVNTYNHYSDLWKIAQFAKFNPLKVAKYFQWDALAKAMFDRVLSEGGTFHLWGHSWELEEHEDWEKLENVLKYIAHRDEARYVTNGDLVSFHTKKALIVAPYFLPHLGGVEMYVFNIAQGLKQAGWDACVVTTKFGLRTEVKEYDGLKVYQLPYVFKIFNTPVNPFWYFSLRKIIKIEKPDLINAHSPVPLLSDITAVAAKHVPFVLTYHAGTMQKGIWFADSIIWMYEHFVLKRTAAVAQKIICSSEFVRNSVFQDVAEKAYTVTPGVNVELFKPLDEVPKKENEIVFVCSLAVMHQLKGLYVLIGALDMLVDKIPNLSLKIIGERGTVAAKYVNFVGPKRGEDLVREMQTGSLLALCSLMPAESFGMVLIEAMSCKMPVVGSNTGGIPEVINNGEDGFIVQPENSIALAVVIERLLHDKELSHRMGEEGYKKVRRMFTWQHKIAQTTSIFESVL